jgi:hypothetical protein
MFDLVGQKVTKYDFGVTWEPAEKCLVGFKHESTDKEKLSIGKFLFMFYHNTNTANIVGTEFSLDWQKKVVEARFGLNHKFTDDYSGKLKVNHKGHIDGALKFKICDIATAVVTTGMDIQSIAQ